jgi:hypothetical protein
VPNESRVGEEIVVVRVRLVVSAEGGGGSDARVDARQRKHSPLPKYLGAGRGYSDRYAPNVCGHYLC